MKWSNCDLSMWKFSLTTGHNESQKAYVCDLVFNFIFSQYDHQSRYICTCIRTRLYQGSTRSMLHKLIQNRVFMFVNRHNGFSEILMCQMFSSFGKILTIEEQILCVIVWRKRQLDNSVWHATQRNWFKIFILSEIWLLK